MSAMAEKARSDAKSKVSRMTTTDPHQKVDASSWTPPEPMHADVQTGMRPISRRQFKRGGKVEGAKAAAHAGRKPRASGGALTATSLINRNVKEANESRVGTKHVGGMKKGGRVHADEAQDRKLIHEMGCKCAKCGGGRVGKASGGASYGGTRPQGGRIARAKGGKTDWSAVMANRRPLPAKEFDAENAAELAKGHAPMSPEGREGFSAPGRGSRAPGSSRMARAKGGRAKKGMNVNIIIAPSGAGAFAPRPPMPMPPPGGPVGMHQGPPPPVMPAGVGAAPPMAPPAGMPMARKSGGRAYPIESGAGGGLGRLEKAQAYASGGAAYPIKDGAGGGNGRLEKARAYG
jgi:hypothetical protein